MKETERRQSTNEKIRGIDVRMMSTSPSKQTTSMSKEQNRAMRKKDHNRGQELMKEESPYQWHGQPGKL